MRIARNIALVLLLLLVIAGIGLFFVVRSVWFGEQVRARIVLELERATGGKVELDAFHFNPATWTASVDGLTIHGTEPPEALPLMRVKRAAVGLQLVSLIDRRVNVLSIDVDTPDVSLIRDAQGQWNFPRTGRQSTITPFERFIDLKAGRVRVVNGTVRLDERRIPLAFEAQQTEVSVTYDPSEAYIGSAKAAAVHVTRPFRSPIDASVATNVRMDKGGVSFDQAAIGFGDSVIHAKGRMDSWTTPRLTATAEGEVLLADLKRPLALPLEPRGRARFSSNWTISSADLAGNGTLAASGLDWTVAGVRITPFAVDTDWHITRREAIIDRAEADLLGGRFQGKARVTDWRDYTVEGDLADLALSRLYSLRDSRAFPWSGIVSGPVRAEGSIQQLALASGQLTIAQPPPPEDGTEPVGKPVQGAIHFAYNAERRQLQFDPSTLELARSRAEFSGDPTTELRINASTSDLTEVLPAVEFFTGRSITVPITLGDAPIRVQGTIANRNSFTGALETGTVTVRDARFNATLDRVRTDIAATPTELRLNGFRIDQDAAAAYGSLRLGWNNGQTNDQSPISGNIQLNGVDLARALGEANLQSQIPAAVRPTGTLSTALDIAGTIGNPSATGDVRLTRANLYGQPLDRARVTLRVNKSSLVIESGDAASARATAQFSGTYTPSAPDWKTGRATFNATADLGALRRWFPSLPEGFEANARGNAKGEVAINAARATLISLDGAAAIPQITLNGRPLGDANVQATSTGRTMSAQLTARMLGSQVRGSAEWSLTGANPGLGQAQVTGLTLDNLRTFGLFGDPDRPLGARGSLDAEFAFRGPVLRPAEWTATARVTRLLLEPRPTESTIDTARFALRNSGPLSGTFDQRGFTIDRARLVGEDTDLNIAGTVGFRTRTPWNLALRGSFNLSGLSVLEPDIEATGVSVLDATVRGELYRPSINGQMELNGASFRLRNVPNGLDQVTGLIRFDTNRATIEKLTAQSGGGNLALTGFVGFGGPQLVYRLQSDISHVRVRYPNEVSTTFDGKISLSGTSAQSLLSGDVTVQRLSLQAETDFLGLVASTSRSAQTTPTQNPILRGMQLDVHVVTAPDAELQTSLTRDLQPQADLRIRGTSARPVALGRATISEGELTFFGNRYRVNRGEIGFFNPSRIEPVLNFDLETIVRGVTVNINLAGSIDKLSTSYRSDPPLQSNEIISLIAVGRTNTTPGNQGITTPTTTSAFQQSAGGGSLLGAAVTSPVSGRLQRLFGISRINIDPDLNATSPQARLTIEQQVSREIRLTYITNLNRSQNQIVRMQWDISPEYSLVAVRDENGLFGVDVLFRKRFR